MHKNLYKFTIKKNKCDITIKSTIKKRTISGEKKWLRERERVLPFFFFHGQLGKNRGEMWKGSNKKVI